MTLFTPLFYTGGMESETQPDTKGRWERTAVENLVKHRQSGVYYARFKIAGKPKWISLRTDKITVARIRLSDERQKVERQRLVAANVTVGAATMEDLIEIWKQGVERRVGLSEQTRLRYKEHAKALAQSWPGLLKLAPSQVTLEEVEKWRDRVHADGTGNRPPNAKAVSSKVSGGASGTINKRIDALRQILNIAVSHGQLGRNPLLVRHLKLKDRPHRPNLPDNATLAKVFEEIELNSGSLGKECADFCRFLTYTGCRLREAAATTWGDVSHDFKMLRVRGTKTDGSDRGVPLNPAAAALLQKRERGAASDHLFNVSEAQKSLTRACAKVKIARLTHHDLRDVFATTALEAGVAVQVVAGWLGHVDGGALLLRRYAHLRQKHSLEAAQLVRF